MLVVIGIIVLAMTLAIPAIKSLTGSRSQEAAQNTLSAFINSVRTEAMGLQHVEGVMFFLDTTTDKVNCAAVMQAPGTIVGPGGLIYLDIVPDRDTFELPAGIRLWTMRDTPPPPPVGLTYNDPIKGAHFLGYSPNFTNPSNPTNNGYTYGTLTSSADYPALTNIPGGVILFDGFGRLLTTRYGLHLTNGTTILSGLGQLIYSGVPSARWSSLNLSDWPPATGPQVNAYLSSQIGLVLFDKDTFLNQASGSTQFQDNNDISGTIETAMEQWLDINTTPIFINRYDGSLMRAE